MVTKFIGLVLMMLVVRTRAIGYFGAPGMAAVHPMGMPVLSPFGGNGGGGGYAPVQQRMPETLTCISKDLNDPTSQIRLTLSGSRSYRRNGGGGYSYAAFGDDDMFDELDYNDDVQAMMFGGVSSFGGMGGGDDVRSLEHRVDGTLIPSMNINKAGTYQVVLTTYGRTADGCSAQALGPIYRGSPNVNRGGGGYGGFGGLGGMGFGGMGYGMGMGMGGMGFSPMGFGGGFMGPYSTSMYNGGGFWGGQNQMGGGGGGAGPMLGMFPNPAIVGGSATIYSAHINGVSRDELLGRGIALCRSVNNGKCEGYIPYCCTIQRDSLPAMELFVQSVGTDDDNSFAFGSFSVGGGAPMGNGAIGLGGATAGNINGPATIAATGGLF